MSLKARVFFLFLILCLAGLGIVLHGAWVAQVSNPPQFVSYLVFSLMVLVIAVSCRSYLGKLENGKRHMQELAAVHMRTVEALALAIEAKDQSTHDHLQRVRIYALELGQRLNLSQAEMEALRAAALLHDIGKLAVPEYIISKPGLLTPEEFEKVKIHPVVGAEILERVQFPHPVAPIVRSHHEKWDGSGYPDGLKGEEIPIGARILSTVDCFDALATTRPYRAALPLPEAMQKVKSESGKSFDPQVVGLLEKHHVELEELVRLRANITDRLKLSLDLKVVRGLAPAAGFEQGQAGELPHRASFLASIANARQEVQTLFELSHDLGNSLSLDETLSVLSVRLKRLVPYDAMVAFVLSGSELVPEHVSGDGAKSLASLRIPLGEGTSGWVAQNRKTIINSNPSLEPGYTHDKNGPHGLRSSISVPLEGLQGVVGVLTLYHNLKDAYTSHHLRILTAISSKVALSMENALACRQAENSATTDYLTGLPNARSLLLHLDRELARCKRLNDSLAVMVCDLNGFKRLNDRFGQLEGNRVLRHFAKGLQSACRDCDYPARTGGDEFVIVVPGISLSAAESRAASLGDLAAAAGSEVCGEDLSLSVGCAAYPDDGSNAERLLAEADRRMYRTKQQHYGARKADARLVLVSSAAEPQGNTVQ